MIGVILAILAFCGPALADNLDKAEREQKRLEADKSNLNKEIQLLEQENARQAKLVQEKVAAIAKLKAELAELQKQRDQHAANLKTAEKGTIDADRELVTIDEEVKVTRTELEKITVKASLATTEYDQKRQALLTKKADLMAQKALLKRRTDEFEATSKSAEADMNSLNRDIARLGEPEPQSKKKGKRRPIAAKPVAEPKPTLRDEFAPREDKSQRLFTIDDP